MTATRTDADLETKTAAAYLALADLLRSATDEQWNVASLCAGWRIREVIAHVTMPARYTSDQIMEELKAHEFDFTRLSNHIANRDSVLPTAELLANLESETLHHWIPPGGGQHGALNHAVIHALDAAHPLNATDIMDDDTIIAALDDLTAGGIHAHFGTTIEGRQLEATDLPWDYGTGRTLRGPARELTLTLCGRVMPANHLDGPAL